MRVKGVGGEYAYLLTLVGCRTLNSLRSRKAHTLWERLDKASEKDVAVQRRPNLKMVEEWIRDARELEQLVS